MESYDAVRLEFGTLLDWHLNRGTAPKFNPDRPGKEKWSNEAFRKACGVKAAHTVRNWRNGKNVPSNELFAFIEEALLGDVSTEKVDPYLAWRSDLRKAHAAAQAAKNLPDDAIVPTIQGTPGRPPNTDTVTGQQSIDVDGRFTPLQRGNVAPSISFYCSSEQEHLSLAEMMNGAVNTILSKSGWFLVVPPGFQNADDLNVRYRIKGRLYRRDSNVIGVNVWMSKLNILALGQPDFEHESFAYVIGSNAHILVEQINGWVQRHVFKWEEKLGRLLDWQSEDVRQLLIWAYLLWAKMNFSSNIKARELLSRATVLDRQNSRAWNLLAQTYVEGIHKGWEIDRQTGIKKIDAYAEHCVSFLARPDAETYVTLAHAHRFKGYRKEAIRCLESAREENQHYAIGPIFLALNNSFDGNFGKAIEILETSLPSHSGDPSFSLGKQIGSQAHFLSKKYDFGEAAARESLRANPASTAAQRSLAANLVAMDRVEDAKIQIIESQKGPPFNTLCYKDQDWVGGKIERFMSALHVAGVSAK
jgi:tetratricopeptide (TPR) repeat protein